MALGFQKMRGLVRVQIKLCSFFISLVRISCWNRHHSFSAHGTNRTTLAAWKPSHTEGNNSAATGWRSTPHWLFFCGNLNVPAVQLRHLGHANTSGNFLIRSVHYLATAPNPPVFIHQVMGAKCFNRMWVMPTAYFPVWFSLHQVTSKMGGWFLTVLKTTQKPQTANTTVYSPHKKELQQNIMHSHLNNRVGWHIQFTLSSLNVTPPPPPPHTHTHSTHLFSTVCVCMHV